MGYNGNRFSRIVDCFDNSMVMGGNFLVLVLMWKGLGLLSDVE
jgi:hypothetical protein